MAETPTPETHATIPVLEPNTGDIHNIGVPFGTDIADLHAALSDYYVAAHPQPTEAGAIENQDSFRQAARTAIVATNSSQTEHGFVVNKNGDVVPAPNAGENHSMQLAVHPSDEATLHVHPGNESQGYTATGPSPNDVQLSQKTGVPFYVSTKTGLWMVRPSDGKVLQVFNKADWAAKNYQQSGTKKS